MGAHVSALVVEELVVDREDASLRIDRRAYAVPLLARVVARHEVLAPVLDPFDRTAEPHGGDADQHVLGIKLAANAETAADVRLVALHRRR